MFEMIYIEEGIQEHPKTKEICHKFPNIPKIICERYGEVFNRQAQNFRLQKGRPSLILARKFDRLLLPTPENYGIGGSKNFYFSHMLNCIYDCRYCFLQGMYNSAHYVIFINFEDFEKAIEIKIQEYTDEVCYFFSGYDCDSLALESITHFAKQILPLFSRYPHAYLELRTKSLNISFLLKQPPLPNCIIAYSLTPRIIAEAFEHRTPRISRRLQALSTLQNKGWPIGLRFDPIIFCENYQHIYQEFFQEVFQKINPFQVHSVSLGPFRLPKGIYKKMALLYPDEKLFAYALEERNGMVTYEKQLEREMIDFCTNQILQYIPSSSFFPCLPKTIN